MASDFDSARFRAVLGHVPTSVVVVTGLDAQGAPQRGIRLVGALRRGDLWESTAVPELRVQAAVAAESLARELGISKAATA